METTGLPDALARVQAAHKRAPALKKSKRAASSREDQRQITLKIDANTLHVIEARAHRAGTPRNAYIHEMILQGMAATISPPATATTTATPSANYYTPDYQAILLMRLEKEFGVDTAPAAGLSGQALTAWIDAAEEEAFEREFAEFQAETAAFKAQFKG